MKRRTFIATIATIFLGGCSGAGDGPETPAPANNTPTPTPTPSQSPTPTATPSPTPEETMAPQPPTPDATPTDTPRRTPTSEGLAPIHDQPTQTPQPVSGGGDFESYDTPDLKTALAEQLNQQRSAVGVPEVRTDSSLANRLSQMAQEHSEDMARKREAALEIDGIGPEDRYEEHEISCAFQDNNDKLIVQEEKIVLVAVTGVSGAENAAASVIQQWKSDEKTQRIMTLKNARHAGVGVAVINGNAYVVLNFC